jgi:hypothetical protein
MTTKKSDWHSPTFVARFADGTVTRMTTYCEPKTFDPARGIRLAWAAYDSRKKQAPPAITEAHFERDSEISWWRSIKKMTASREQTDQTVHVNAATAA